MKAVLLSSCLWTDSGLRASNTFVLLQHFWNGVEEHMQKCTRISDIKNHILNPGNILQLLFQNTPRSEVRNGNAFVK
jgi:hypothetical protein